MNCYLRNIFPLLIALAIIGTSCSTSNDVASNGLFQKRKYRNGIHLNISKKDQKTPSVQEHVIANADNTQDSSATDTEFNGVVESTKVKSDGTKRSLLTKSFGKNQISKIKTLVELSNPPNDAESDKIIQKPESETKTNTLTSSYQKKGKLALLFAWIFALMPAVIWGTLLLGFPELIALALLIAFVALLIALILSFSNFKYSAHARRALLVVLLAIVFWAVAGTVFNFVLGIALF